MRKLIIFYLLALTACATPVTVLQNSKGQTETCGGETGPSIAGGIIGYAIAKNGDADCVSKYQQGGFKVVKVTQ